MRCLSDPLLSSILTAVNSKLVERLARLEPTEPSGTPQGASAFSHLHQNAAFGWHIARAFARARVRFPVTVLGRDHWLFQAYLLHLNLSKGFDPCVLEAHQLNQQSGRSAKLKALLIAGLGSPVDAHLELVAEKTGIPVRTVAAFEILFFNVLDRHQDVFYISNIVYPEGRMVEFDEDYFETTPIQDLILRVAYNSRDIDLVEHLAGMESADCMKALTALRDGEATLEKQIIGNALLMAKAGMLNQRSVGFQRATTLLAAKHHPPLNTTTDVDGQKAHDLATELASALAAMPTITEVDRQELRAAFHPGRSYWSDDTGKINAFDDDVEVANTSQSVTPSTPMVWFPKPVSAVWRNKDSDRPVILIARMSEPGLPDHYLTNEKSGIPVSEVFFEN